MNTRELLNLENAERDPVLLCTLSFVFSVSYLFLPGFTFTLLGIPAWDSCSPSLPLILLPFPTLLPISLAGAGLPTSKHGNNWDLAVEEWSGVCCRRSLEPCHRKMMQLCSGTECSILALNSLRAASLGLWSPQVWNVCSYNVVYFFYFLRLTFDSRWPCVHS